MDSHEDEGLRLLAPLRDVEPGAGTGVDIAKAKSAGRRTSRRRMITGVAAAASLAVLAGLGVPALVRSVPNSLTPAAGEFDLFKQVVTVGSAGGFTPSSYHAMRDRQLIYLRRADGGSGEAAVEVYAPGKVPQDVLNSRVGAAGDVNGRSAVWAGDGGMLLWQWKDGAYATVSAINVPDPDVLDRIHRVAQSVQPAEKPFVMPFTLPYDKSLELESVWVEVGRPVSWAHFKHDGPTGRATLSVGLVPNEPGLVPNTSVGGRPAVAGSHEFKIPDFLPGIMVTARTGDYEGEPDVVKQLATNLQLTGNPTRRETWQPTIWR